MRLRCGLTCILLVVVNEDMRSLARFAACLPSLRGAEGIQDVRVIHQFVAEAHVAGDKLLSLPLEAIEFPSLEINLAGNTVRDRFQGLLSTTEV